MTKAVEDVAPPAPLVPTVREARRAAAPGVKKKPSVYLTPPVHEQLRTLAFQERKNMHDYLLEGLDLVFRQRGLPSIAELNAKGEA
jgi:hypothetical protein